MGSEEEDDYMSNDFLISAETVKPGISSHRGHRRLLKIENERFSVEQKNRQVPKKAELEKNRLEEGLNLPVSETSKGFALLAKMGFKPGMSLGKKTDANDLGSGIKEPIQLNLKVNRTGLGHEKVVDEKRKERIEAQMARMKDRASRNVELMEEYRKRKRDGSTTKQLIGDIIRSRKTCLELDLRISMDVPAQPWFWKTYKVVAASGSEEKIRSTLEKELEEEEAEYTYSNGKSGPKEERFDEMTDDVLEERLEEITAYLREKHFYCVWCGCLFASTDELSSECPGPHRHLHDVDE